MRRLIGQPVDEPTRQPLVLTDTTLKLFRHWGLGPRSPMALLTHGFGCPNACEYCLTSAFYNARHVPFCTGRKLYDAMVDVHAATGVGNFWIFGCFTRSNPVSSILAMLFA